MDEEGEEDEDDDDGMLGSGQSPRYVRHTLRMRNLLGGPNNFPTGAGPRCAFDAGLLAVLQLQPAIRAAIRKPRLRKLQAITDFYL